MSRSSIQSSKIWPRASRTRNAIIDGEIVTLDADGRSNFHTLQHRLGVQNPSRQLMQSVPLDYFAFDVMYADGYDLRRSPLVERKDFLQQILSPNERIHFSEHIPEQGEALYEAARGKGLEGIIAKLKNSTYAGARTSTWVKLKIVSEVDAVVAGYTEGRGSRKFFGALVLGLYEGRELKFIGSVGTGFDESQTGRNHKATRRVANREITFRQAARPPRKRRLGRAEARSRA